MVTSWGLYTYETLKLKRNKNSYKVKHMHVVNFFTLFAIWFWRPFPIWCSNKWKPYTQSTSLFINVSITLRKLINTSRKLNDVGNNDIIRMSIFMKIFTGCIFKFQCDKNTLLFIRSDKGDSIYVYVMLLLICLGTLIWRPAYHVNNTHCEPPKIGSAVVVWVRMKCLQRQRRLKTNRWDYHARNSNCYYYFIQFFLMPPPVRWTFSCWTQLRTHQMSKVPLPHISFGVNSQIIDRKICKHE